MADGGLNLTYRTRGASKNIGGSTMLNKVLVAAAIFTAVASPVFAQADITCDQAAMAKLETDVSQVTDSARKELAQKELAMAKEALAANDQDKCKTHMSNAMKGNDPM
ncbi:hypothetical protein QN224_25270 [Sinorhizobium sp. 8-89]|nr:hypothetical protein [Sinorhizobium sp. 7-81]MDK1388724.1 hypothetical protein [Sinorhizobium sp. 7-81]